jgi:hypothetical protein
MGALYFGVGKALGGLAGGIAIDQLGDRLTFRYKTNIFGSFSDTRTKIHRLTFWQRS